MNHSFCHAIWLRLAPNMAGITSQYGWDCRPIWLELDCNKAEGVLSLTRPDFT